MTKILVLHGAGMNMRGKVQLETFGPMTMADYDAKIRGYAKDLGVTVEIFHSNSEGAVVDRLYSAHEEAFDGAIFKQIARILTRAVHGFKESASSLEDLRGMIDGLLTLTLAAYT